MKFTSEDLMKAMGLNVGDRVKCIFMGVADEGLGGKTFELKKSCKGYISIIGEDKGQYPLPILLDRDFEILPRPKRVGELKCRYFECCSKCPLRAICESVLFNGDDITLYEILEKYIKSGENSFDQEIYNLLKSRLDKEVVEE